VRSVTSASTRDPFFFGPPPVRQLPHVRAPRSGRRARRLSRPPHPSRVCSGRRRPPVHAARRGRARLPPRRPSRLGVAVPVRLVVSIPAASRGLIPAARRGLILAASRGSSSLSAANLLRLRRLPRVVSSGRRTPGDLLCSTVKIWSSAPTLLVRPPSAPSARLHCLLLPVDCCCLSAYSVEANFLNFIASLSIHPSFACACCLLLPIHNILSYISAVLRQSAFCSCYIASVSCLYPPSAFACAPACCYPLLF